MKKPGNVNKNAAKQPAKVANGAKMTTTLAKYVPPGSTQQTPRIHPHFSWDPLTNSNPIPEAFAVGKSTFLPMVSRNKIMSKQDDTNNHTAGHTILAFTPSSTGIAALSMTMNLSTGVPYVYIDSMLFPRMTENTMGNLPTSSKDGRYGYTLRNVSDQLKLGGTVRSLRLQTGIVVPTIGDSTFSVDTWNTLCNFIWSHPDTATYSGNQLTQGKSKASIPCDQSIYGAYTPWVPTPASYDAKIDWLGGTRYELAMQLRAAIGQEHGDYHHQGDAAAKAAAGSSMAAVKNRLGHPTPSSYQGVALTPADQTALNAAATTDNLVNFLSHPSMSVCLLMIEARLENQNAYEVTIGQQVSGKYEADNMLNSLAVPTKTAPIAHLNAMRAAGETTKSFLQDVGDVAKDIGRGLADAVSYIPPILSGVSKIRGLFA